VTAPPTDSDEQPWRQLLRDALAQPLLWYVRRRHLPIPTNTAGTAVSANSVVVSEPRGLTRLMSTDASLSDGMRRLRSVNVPEVATLSRRLTERRFVDNPALLRSIVARAAGSAGTTPSAAAAVAALGATTDPALGKGLALLTAQSGALARTLNSDRIVEAGVLPEIDRLARDVPPNRLAELATELRNAVKANEDIEANLADLRRRLVSRP
jgi:hypothetical protein